jgi:hypothetical protein
MRRKGAGISWREDLPNSFEGRKNHSIARRSERIKEMTDDCELWRRRCLPSELPSEEGGKDARELAKRLTLSISIIMTLD